MSSCESSISSIFLGTLTIKHHSIKFTIEVDTSSKVPFIENMKQGHKLERKGLMCCGESHACQPANSLLSVLFTTKAADKQPNQNDSRKNQQSYKGKGAQNEQLPCL